MKKYYIISVLFSLGMSLLGVYMSLSGKATDIVALLILISIFLYAYFKRDEVLGSKWRKWAILTLSSLFFLGTIGSMVIFLILPLFQ